MAKQTQIDSNALRGHLETMILSALEARESHGFDVLQRLEAAGFGALRMKEGSLYPALYRLEEQGHVTSRWENDNDERPGAGRRGPKRKLYKLTRKGKRKLDQGREHWSVFVSVIGGIIGVPA